MRFGGGACARMCFGGVGGVGAHRMVASLGGGHPALCRPPSGVTWATGHGGGGRRWRRGTARAEQQRAPGGGGLTAHPRCRWTPPWRCQSGCLRWLPGRGAAVCSSGSNYPLPPTHTHTTDTHPQVCGSNAPPLTAFGVIKPAPTSSQVPAPTPFPCLRPRAAACRHPPAAGSAKRLRRLVVVWCGGGGGASPRSAAAGPAGSSLPPRARSTRAALECDPQGSC